ncbi:poly(hydroxyalkanoate) depolymerase family esterase [Palleronia aestuarii]|uniref:Poly(Hydroxyalkanoate) depolymerase family esterase n=1 Tax=Palleronia aestuarii TaxID=568105 RepID=A0A2W7NMP1_9RHOB|nr:PHB depolymerase family esterase [Palleronia aestuarii]PZX14446.1 poly(hydroxyalkanoate) depolymerase family esterase [Palleronia aestuarii]
MKNDFTAALGRALEATRAGDPAAATDYIRSAFSGGTTTEPSPAQRNHRPDATFRGMPDLSSLPGMAGMPDLPGMHDLPGRKPARTVPVPDGATVEWRRIAGRDVRLFTPSPREGGLKGLVLMLHGCTQAPDDFALGTRMDGAAEAAGFAIAYPEQTRTHNMNGCWNWFRAQDQQAGSGEPATLSAIAVELAGELGLGGRVFAAGLSAGGAMAAVLAETHPDLFTAVGIHSGLPTGAATDMQTAFSAMRGERGGRPLAVPGIVFQGTADRTVAPANARHLVPGDGIETRHGEGARRWTRLTTGQGSELWTIKGAGHAWSGGDTAGSYADAGGPDASAEMLRFFGEIAARN